jgi:hypothetical protein
MQINNKISKKERVDGLRVMMEAITSELSSTYEEEGEKISLNKLVNYSAHISYISLEKPVTKRRLRDGFKQKTVIEEELIFAVSEQFSDEPDEENNLGVLVASSFDNKNLVRDIVNIYLKNFQIEYAPINAHSENFKYLLRDKKFKE